MSSRFNSSLSKSAARIRTKGRRRGGLPSMSESQTQAYLITRDVLRRIQRTSSHHFPEVGEPEIRGQSLTIRTRAPWRAGGIEPMGERA